MSEFKNDSTNIEEQDWTLWWTDDHECFSTQLYNIWVQAAQDDTHDSVGWFVVRLRGGAGCDRSKFSTVELWILRQPRPWTPPPTRTSSIRSQTYNVVKTSSRRPCGASPMTWTDVIVLLVCRLPTTQTPWCSWYLTECLFHVSDSRLNVYNEHELVFWLTKRWAISEKPFTRADNVPFIGSQCLFNVVR